MISTILPQAIASGIVTGSIYALVAVALIIIYKSTDVINFAGGDFVMVGGYIGLVGISLLGLPYALGIMVTAVVMWVLGAAFDRIVLQRIGQLDLHQSVLVSMVIATVGLSYVFRGVVRLFPYTEEVRSLPVALSGGPLFVGNVVFQRQDIVIVTVTIFLIAGLFWFFGYTALGKALRATSQNPRAAELVGIPVMRMRLFVWGIAAALSGISGILIGAKLPLTPDIGGSVILLAFAAAIIGGFTSLPGAIVGGFLLGIGQNLVGVLISSSAISVTPFVVIMLVLTLRPQGLFGGVFRQKKV